MSGSGSISTKDGAIGGVKYGTNTLLRRIFFAELFLIGVLLALLLFRTAIHTANDAARTTFALITADYLPKAETFSGMMGQAVEKISAFVKSDTPSSDRADRVAWEIQFFLEHGAASCDRFVAKRGGESVVDEKIAIVQDGITWYGVRDDPKKKRVGHDTRQLSRFLAVSGVDDYALVPGPCDHGQK